MICLPTLNLPSLTSSGTTGVVIFEILIQAREDFVIGDVMMHSQRNQKILNAIAEETKLALQSKKAARAALISEGIYTTKGKLRVEFGGERKKARSAA